MKTINEIQNQIIDEFAFFDDWEEKYNLLIDFGKTLSPLADTEKQDDNRVKGCQSQVWVVADAINNNQISFRADSDSVITKGIIAMLLRIFNNQAASDIANADLYCIEQIGLREHLSPNRSNGLSQMVKKIKLMAIAFQN